MFIRFGIIVLALLLIRVDSVNATPTLPATFLVNDCGIPYGAPPVRCREPMQPASVYYAQGCGFVIGKPVFIHDEVVLANGYWPIDPQYVGQYRDIWDSEMPDALGCLRLSVQAWGSGNHSYSLYQVLNGPNMKLVARDSTDTWFHHLEYSPGMLNIDYYDCLTYRPPRPAGSPFWSLNVTPNYDYCFLS